MPMAWAGFVVLGDPIVQRRLGGREAGQDPIGQELGSQGAVEPLDLARGGRGTDAGEAVDDAVLAADPVEEHLGRGGGVAAGEDLAVVGEDLVGHAVFPHGVDEMAAHRSGPGVFHEPGAHAEPGVVIDTGQGLELGPVDQDDPADYVELPQLHRPVPLPADPVLPPPLVGGFDQPLADQRPIDRRAGRRRLHAPLGQHPRQPGRPPPRMLPAQLTQRRLDRRRHLVRTGERLMRPVLQRRHSTGFIPADPAVDRLA
jgi:hypothetical protein